MKAAALGLIALASTAIAYSVYQSAVKVTLDGKVVTSRGWVKDGVVYVPATDLAKALGKSYAYSKASGTAQIGDAGGANQKKGADGKAGEQLFNGLTRVTVASSFVEHDGKMVLDIEVRNAEKAKKIYRFGSAKTKFTLYDAAGTSLEPNTISDDYFSVDLDQAGFKKIQVKYTFPAGFKPVRLVLSLSTQVPVQGENGIKDEIFRVSFE